MAAPNRPHRAFIAAPLPTPPAPTIRTKLSPVGINKVGPICTFAPLRGPLASGVLYSQSDSANDLAHAMKVVREDYRKWLEKAQVSRAAAWRMYGSQAVCDSMLRVLGEAARKAH